MKPTLAYYGQYGDLVQCIIADGPLVLNNIYTIEHVTENGNFLLQEVEPPIPHTSFDPKRFKFTGTNILDIAWVTEAQECLEGT